MSLNNTNIHITLGSKGFEVYIYEMLTYTTLFVVCSNRLLCTRVNALISATSNRNDPHSHIKKHGHVRAGPAHGNFIALVGTVASASTKETKHITTISPTFILMLSFQIRLAFPHNLFLGVS